MFIACNVYQVGYDAYCVAGKAPKWVTTRNLSKMDCPIHCPDVELVGVGGFPVVVAGGKGEHADGDDAHRGMTLSF